MANKEAVIIGAGKIGRGYLADLFCAAGYHLTFLEENPELAASLKAQGRYTLFRSNPEGGYDEIRFQDFDVFCTRTEYAACVEVLSRVNYGGMATYADGFRAIGQLLADAAKARMAAGNGETLDILIAANWVSPDAEVREAMLERAENEAQRAFMQEKVGLIQTLPIRGGYPPTAQMLAQDPLAVAATDFPSLPVDEEAFRGAPAEGLPFMMLDRMTARLNCKLWTSNVRGAMCASFAKQKGYDYVQQYNDDEEIQRWATLGHREAIYGACRAFGFEEEDLHLDLFRAMPAKTKTKQVTSDTIYRQLHNLKRKLAKTDRLVGPALACLKGGKVPFYLSKAIAYAFAFENPTDPDAVEVLACVAEQGFGAAVVKYCDLDLADPAEKELYDLILAQHYEKTPADLAWLQTQY